MMLEIERKFLVTSEAFKKKASEKRYLIQAYLNSDPARSVRVRISEKKAFLTIKGTSSASGLSRFEWEKEIEVKEAEELLKLCEPGRIEKYRYLVKMGKHTYEVDEFLGNHKGLLLAEIELQSEKEDFEKPVWLGKEVTSNKQYYNLYLLNHPLSH